MTSWRSSVTLRLGRPFPTDSNTAEVMIPRAEGIKPMLMIRRAVSPMDSMLLSELKICRMGTGMACERRVPAAITAAEIIREIRMASVSRLVFPAP